MNHRSQKQKARKPHHDLGGLIPPAEMFSRVLSGQFILDADLPFEQRVERAWARLKLTKFAPEEHERLRKYLTRMIAEENIDD